MKRILRQLFHFIFHFAVHEARKRVERQVKLKSLQVYLKALKVTRLTLSGILALLFVLQVCAMGLLTALGAALYLAPWEPQVKAIVALSVGGALFVIPLFLALFALSDRTWFKYSGAEQMMSDLTREMND